MGEGGAEGRGGGGETEEDGGEDGEEVGRERGERGQGGSGERETLKEGDGSLAQPTFWRAGRRASGTRPPPPEETEAGAWRPRLLEPSDPRPAPAPPPAPPPPAPCRSACRLLPESWCPGRPGGGPAMAHKAFGHVPGRSSEHRCWRPVVPLRPVSRESPRLPSTPSPPRRGASRAPWESGGAQTWAVGAPECSGGPRR